MVSSSLGLLNYNFSKPGGKGRTDGKSPHSTGLRLLPVPLPKKEGGKYEGSWGKEGQDGGNMKR